MNNEPTWQEFYKLAVLETDWSKMEDRIRAAETALEQRMLAANLDHGGVPEENLEVLATLQRLNGLRGELARWHGLKKSDSGSLSE
jgi:hypothetical protein